MRSQGEIEAAVGDAIARFQQEFMGRGPRHVQAHLVENRVFVHLEGVLTAAEERLMAGGAAADGRAAELLKQLRSRLVTAGRSELEMLVHEAAGCPPVNLHHDISPSTGEEVIVITLAATPVCRFRKAR